MYTCTKLIIIFKIEDGLIKLNSQYNHKMYPMVCMIVLGVVMVHLIFKHIYIHVELLASCTLLCCHLHMVINTIKHYISTHALSKHLKYLKIKLNWGLSVPFRSLCLYLHMIVNLWLLLGFSFHWPHMVRLCHNRRHTLGRLRHLVPRYKRLQMRLSFSVSNTISCNNLVASWFRTQTINNCWVPTLASGILIHHMLTYIKIMGR